MNDHKQYFKMKLEIYCNGRNLDDEEKSKYLKKVLRDKMFKQKLLSVKSEDVAIEIEVLTEMLEDVTWK